MKEFDTKGELRIRRSLVHILYVQFTMDISLTQIRPNQCLIYLNTILEGLSTILGSQLCLPIIKCGAQQNWAS